MTWNPLNDTFVYHAPTWKDAVGGFARCRACGRFFTGEQFLSEPCSGIPAPVKVPACAGSVACRFCGKPIAVAPRHWETVETFGTTCAGCFGLVEAARA